ncbi:hypothetical protein GCM10011575_38510 [Microlunatus endophyticus]|uniref:Uncharacterized protein n=1 Tax=Microlunatus endophyticus TaxID=1716077 RepID=A0A917SF80_9ACTN|nr:hypothetical protein GCM10011575_38510 [Microlunatus endophyticus]
MPPLTTVSLNDARGTCLPQADSWVPHRFFEGRDGEAFCLPRPRVVVESIQPEANARGECLECIPASDREGIGHREPRRVQIRNFAEGESAQVPPRGCGSSRKSSVNAVIPRRLPRTEFWQGVERLPGRGWQPVRRRRQAASVVSAILAACD